jgi:hypothetical protein
MWPHALSFLRKRIAEYSVQSSCQRAIQAQLAKGNFAVWNEGFPDTTGPVNDVQGLAGDASVLGGPELNLPWVPSRFCLLRNSA